MKREEMIAMVGEELTCIPRGPRDSPQNYFRAAYNLRRRSDLALNASASRHRSFVAALEAFRTSHPDFTPAYDRGFFSEQ